MIDHPLALSAPHVQSVVVVAHPSFSDAMRAHLDRAWPRLERHVVEQATPTGMLDAIVLATPVVATSDADSIWIVWCDQAGLMPATLERLAAATAAQPVPAMVVATVRRDDPYIHFERGEDGRITRVLQRREGDGMPDRGESDMGLFALSRAAFLQALPTYAREVSIGHETRERNFLPFIPWLAARADVVTIPCTDAREAIGVNTPEELRAAETWLSTRDHVEKGTP